MVRRIRGAPTIGTSRRRLANRQTSTDRPVELPDATAGQRDGVDHRLRQRLGIILGALTMIVRTPYLAAMRMRLARFRRDARRPRAIQHKTLLTKIRRNALSDFGRDHGFSQISSVGDFRRQLHVASYDDHHPYIERVLR